MQNNYKVDGDVTILYLESKCGSYESLIDTEDLDRIKTLPGKWHAKSSKTTELIYVWGNLKVNGKNRNMYIHRFVLPNLQKGMVVDHINSNPLDNRKENLRIVTHRQNMQNRKGSSNSNNKSSGIRGVSFYKPYNKWRAYLTVNGKVMGLGYFEDIKEAEKVVLKARKELMPYSKENLHEAN